MDNKNKKKFKISIFGATGVVGKLFFDIFDNSGEYIKEKIEFGIFSGNKNYDLMIELIKKYRPEFVFLFDENSNKTLKSIFKKLVQNLSKSTKIISDKKEFVKILNTINNKNYFKEKSQTQHLFINAIMGYNGILPGYFSIKNHIVSAVANKESIIILGEFYNPDFSNVYPLDSEHFAIYKLLKSIEKDKLLKIILTASGGVSHKINNINKITIDDLLKHPNWNMGKKITIDSSTGVNKAFEVIETLYLFNIELEKIDVLLNKSSNIHAIIKDVYNNYYLQASYPDMHQSMIHFLNEIIGVNLNYPFSDISVENIDYNLDKINYNIFKVLDFVLKSYDRSKYIGTKLIVINDILTNFLIEKKITFKDFNYLFFKSLDKFYDYSFKCKSLVKECDIFKLLNDIEKFRSNCLNEILKLL